MAVQFVESKKTLLTCRHVVQDFSKEDLKVFQEISGTKVEYQVVEVIIPVELDADVAILVVNEDGEGFVKMAPYKEYEELYQWGKQLVLIYGYPQPEKKPVISMHYLDFGELAISYTGGNCFKQQVSKGIYIYQVEQGHHWYGSSGGGVFYQNSSGEYLLVGLVYKLSTMGKAQDPTIAKKYQSKMEVMGLINNKEVNEFLREKFNFYLTTAPASRP